MLREGAPSKRVGAYVLGRKIGAGGMSTVFAARQESRIGGGRLVALKVMAPAIRDRQRLKLFLREALISTQLDHPNIVRTYEIVRSRGKLYLAMEFLHGVDLASALRSLEGPLPAPVVLHVGVDVASALHAAHELRDPRGEALGIVHQDVSPHNVMVTYDGATKLLDFGVARLLSIDASWTASPKTKTAYVAPEQVTYGRLDRRVDVFALGLVLWELLTGRRLFARPTLAETIAAVVHEPIPDVRAIAAAVPASLAEVVARALARDPEARFQTAAALREALLEATAAGVPRLDAGDVAAWLGRAIPPRASPLDIEREIVAAAGGSWPRGAHAVLTAMLPRRERKRRGIVSFVPPPLVDVASSSDPDDEPIAELRSLEEAAAAALAREPRPPQSDVGEHAGAAPVRGSDPAARNAIRPSDPSARRGSDPARGEGRRGSDPARGDGRRGSDPARGEGHRGSDPARGDGRRGSDPARGDGRRGSDPARVDRRGSPVPPGRTRGPADGAEPVRVGRRTRWLILAGVVAAIAVAFALWRGGR